MSPQRNTETLNLVSISPNSKNEISESISVRNIREEERRITLFHVIVHLLAFILIIPFLVLIIYEREIPEVYATIVSVIVGFYFARSLFKNKD